MHCTTVALSLLAATGALAAPHMRRQAFDNSIRVELSDGGETGAQVEMYTMQDTEVPAISGPFSTVNLRLGMDVQKQDLRCQVLDHMGEPIVVKRGTNVEFSFSDAGKGAWTFREPTMVSSVVCDPSFVKADPNSDDLALRVVLESQATETGSQTVLAAGGRTTAYPIGSSGPFETVELRVGKLVEPQAYRCQVTDTYGNAITVHRGGKTDTTFSDAGKGEWTFDYSTSVGQIICDPTFVSAN